MQFFALVIAMTGLATTVWADYPSIYVCKDTHFEGSCTTLSVILGECRMFYNIIVYCARKIGALNDSLTVHEKKTCLKKKIQ